MVLALRNRGSPENHEYHGPNPGAHGDELRGAFQQRLLDRGVHTAIHYPIAPHQQRAYAKELGHLQFPLAEALHREVVSLPISPVMTDEQAAQVVAAVNGLV